MIIYDKKEQEDQLRTISKENLKKRKIKLKEMKDEIKRKVKINNKRYINSLKYIKEHYVN